MIQHANHYILYEFTLNQVVDLNIVSGLPLKLYPKHTGELFTYGIYVPEGDYDMHNIDLDFESIDMPHTQLKQENDENNSDVMSLLKSNAEKIDVVVLVDSNSRLQEKVLTIQLWSDPDSQKISHMVESFKVSIPERESYKSSRANSDNHKDNQQHNWYHHMLNHGVDISKDNSQEDSLREVKLQYYRGCDYYTKLNEITEYMKAALVSFVSPFVILGVIFSGIALCVFVWLNYPFRQPVEPIPEKA